MSTSVTTAARMESRIGRRRSAGVSSSPQGYTVAGRRSANGSCRTFAQPPLGFLPAALVGLVTSSTALYSSDGLGPLVQVPVVEAGRPQAGVELRVRVPLRRTARNRWRPGGTAAACGSRKCRRAGRPRRCTCCSSDTGRATAASSSSHRIRLSWYSVPKPLALVGHRLAVEFVGRRRRSGRAAGRGRPRPGR